MQVCARFCHACLVCANSGVNPRLLELEVFDVHEHMKALAPEHGRLPTKPGQTPTDSAKIRKGRYRLLGSSWALAWEQVKKELQLTYQEETRVLDRDTPVRMETLYDMLFPARKYEEDTLDGEKVTEVPNKEGSALNERTGHLLDRESTRQLPRNGPKTCQRI